MDMECGLGHAEWTLGGLILELEQKSDGEKWSYINEEFKGTVSPDF
jgi:hypothetical protein